MISKALPQSRKVTVDTSLELSVNLRESVPLLKTKLKVPGNKFPLYLFLSIGIAIRSKEEVLPVPKFTADSASP